jgi:endonuclease YncB( thermonuclease family)
MNFKQLTILFALFCTFSLSAQNEKLNIFLAKFISNHDGDTYKAYILVPSNAKYKDYKWKKVTCRIFQADTYEMRDSGSKKKLAVAAKHFVKAKLTANNHFYVQYVGKDVFGRWLVKTSTKDGENLKEMLADKKYLSGKYENYRRTYRIER